MPGTYTFPGVYIDEIPSGVHTITGVSTSDTAFVDFFEKIQSAEKRKPGTLSKVFATHPMTQNRIT